jgi:WW domain-binding protein 4
MVESAPAESPAGTSEETKPEPNTLQTEVSQEATTKRPLPDPADEEEGRWKLRKKTANVGLGEIYDPGIIPIKPKAKVESSERAGNDSDPPSTSTEPTPGDTGATAKPKWAPVKWKKAGEQVSETTDSSNPAPADKLRTDETTTVSPGPQGGEEESTPTSVANVTVKEEPVKLEEPPAEIIPEGGSLFRKRKTPARGGTNSSGRRS